MRKLLILFLASFWVLFPVLAGALEVGDEAPLSEGISDKGPIKLIDYRGKKNVVLAFYFADFTSI